MDLIGLIESEVGKKAEIIFRPMQAGEVMETYADITDAATDLGLQPKTDIAEGLSDFIRWYRDFYSV